MHMHRRTIHVLKSRVHVAFWGCGWGIGCLSRAVPPRHTQWCPAHSDVCYFWRCLLHHARENLSSAGNVDDWTPFAHGTFRDVARGTYTNGKRKGERFRTGHVFEADFYTYDVKAVEKAIEIVDRWNEKKFIDKSILVSRANVWEGGEGSGIDGKKFLVEPFIDNWQKWNSNSGWQQEGRGQAENSWSDIMQALSHFSFHVSGGALLLCDIQGGLRKNGAVISDPVIMSRTRAYGSAHMGAHSQHTAAALCRLADCINMSSRDACDVSCECVLSVTDLGHVGIRNFFAKHKCNKYCHSGWVKPADMAHLFPTQKSSTLMAMPPPPQSRLALMPPTSTVTRPAQMPAVFKSTHAFFDVSAMD